MLPGVSGLRTTLLPLAYGKGLTSMLSLLSSSWFDASSIPLPDPGGSCSCLPVCRSGGGDWPGSDIFGLEVTGESLSFAGESQPERLSDVQLGLGNDLQDGVGWMR